MSKASKVATIYNTTFEVTQIVELSPIIPNVRHGLSE